MVNKFFIVSMVAILCLSTLAVYLVSQISVLNNSYEELSNSSEELSESHRDLKDEYKETFWCQTLVMPKGLDEHYERIRKYESCSFTKEGDPGWLLFYATQVLHDLGNYTYGLRDTELNDTIGIFCGNLTTQFATRFLEYMNKSIPYTEWLNSNMSKIRITYEWINFFVSYLNDTNGFSRFPVETLTQRWGDCEDQAMALAFLLESSGYETALCLIHDKNLTQYGPEGLYHVFYVARKDDFEYNGTLIQLYGYPEYGNIWIVLDPAFNQPFGWDPEWMDHYKMSNGTVQIPQQVWSSILIDYDATFDRATEIGITLN